jgi:hypothetical protein
LTLPQGLRDSTFTATRTPAGAIRRSSIMGVRPTD